MSKEAIVEKIISDARIKADSFINEQRGKADEILAEAAEKCKTYLYQNQADIARTTEDIIARSKTVAELDARKIVLQKKTQILDDIFARTLEKLVALDDKAMKKLLLGMLKYAEDGDVVVLNARGKELVGAADINKIAKSKNISVSLSEQTGDFAGGMILSGNGVDKNFTFEVEVALMKEELEAGMAREIFD